MPNVTPIGLSDACADDATKQTQWRAFLNKNKLEPMDLRDVIRAIRERVLPLGFPPQVAFTTRDRPQPAAASLLDNY